MTSKKFQKPLYIKDFKRYNIGDIKGKKKGDREVAGLFYDVLASVWIAIAGVDSRWGK